MRVISIVGIGSVHGGWYCIFACTIGWHISDRAWCGALCVDASIFDYYRCVWVVV